jgi:hypothetical protein
VSNPIREVRKLGQSIWYDTLRRAMITGGELQAMVDEGLGGVTANPTIFEKAMAGSNDYDDALRSAVQRGDGDAGALLDPQAKREYRARLEDLRAEIEEAESFNDPERAARAREEMEFIARELSSAVGLGGRDRKAASNAERARVNVTRAVKGVIRRIAADDESLGRELETTVHTGYFCRYEPDPRRPVTWQVDGG